MKKIRIGNDLAVTWSLKRNGEPFNLKGLPLKLYLKNMYDKKEVTDFTVRENVIRWTFFGKDQKNTGEHSLELVAHDGEKGMITVDACDFVRLVSCSCKVSSGSDGCGIKTEVVDIESNVELGGASVDTDTLNEILSTCCSLDFNDDFNNDFTIWL